MLSGSENMCHALIPHHTSYTLCVLSVQYSRTTSTAMQSGRLNWPMITVLYLKWSNPFLQNKWPAQELTRSKETPSLFN